MLKEKFENVKTFVMEHKTEIILGAVVVAGTIIVGRHCKNLKVVNMKKSNNARDHYMEAYNKAADIASNTLIPELNKKYEQYDFSNIDNDPVMKKIFDQYMNEYEVRFEEILQSQF